MTDSLSWFVLIAAAAGGFTVAMVGETVAEMLWALAGAFAGMLATLAGLSILSPPVRFTLATSVDVAVAALWTSMLAWLVTFWWETLTGRVRRSRPLR